MCANEEKLVSARAIMIRYHDNIGKEGYRRENTQSIHRSMYIHTLKLQNDFFNYSNPNPE